MKDNTERTATLARDQTPPIVMANRAIPGLVVALIILGHAGESPWLEAAHQNVEAEKIDYEALFHAYRQLRTVNYAFKVMIDSKHNPIMLSPVIYQAMTRRFNEKYRKLHNILLLTGYHQIYGDRGCPTFRREKATYERPYKALKLSPNNPFLTIAIAMISPERDTLVLFFEKLLARLETSLNAISKVVDDVDPDDEYDLGLGNGLTRLDDESLTEFKQRKFIQAIPAFLIVKRFLPKKIADNFEFYLLDKIKSNNSPLAGGQSKFIIPDILLDSRYSGSLFSLLRSIHKRLKDLSTQYKIKLDSFNKDGIPDNDYLDQAIAANTSNDIDWLQFPELPELMARIIFHYCVSRSLAKEAKRANFSSIVLLKGNIQKKAAGNSGFSLWANSRPIIKEAEKSMPRPVGFTFDIHPA